MSGKMISPSNENLRYMGRIDFSVPDAPVFVYPCTSVSFRFTGSSVTCVVTNIHSYYENSVGIILDGVQKKCVLSDTEERQRLVFDHLPEGEHSLMLFKRMDCCHYLVFHGFILDETGIALPSPDLPNRKIEVYGDSVSAGEVCELVDFCGKADPPHNGEYSNSWYSYSWLTARQLNAQIHDIAQGGIALLENTGYFCAPNCLGMKDMYDKIQYYPYLPGIKQWDFQRYQPHVVIVAIGQNDNHPDDYMEQGIENSKAVIWREHYAAFIRRLRSLYPHAEIILSTTILNHGPNWDVAIDTVCRELNDPKVHHFLYSNNGCGTPGHIRIPEAEKMADELSAYINTLGDEIWEDSV